MVQTTTRTQTWSWAAARRVAGKVAADLRGMQQEYGRPNAARIERLLEELTVLLKHKLVDRITYGFKRNGAWIAALRYVADMSGNLTVDERSGRIPRGVNVDGAVFYSFLVWDSARWNSLTDAERREIERQLPFERGDGDEPRSGPWSTDRTYSSSGSGLRRSSLGGRN